MPSSHFKMEEASTIAASKSGRSDVEDDLEDFVLQIDETEINNELNANGLVDDIDVFKQKNKRIEVTLPQLDLTKKIILDDQQPMECENNVQSGEKNNHTNDLQNVEGVEKPNQLSSNPNFLENVNPIENCKEEAMDIPGNSHNDLELSIGIEGDTKGPKQQCDIAENINTEKDEIIQGQNDCLLPVNGEEFRKVKNDKIVEDTPNAINNETDVSSSNVELELTNKDEKEINNIENRSSDKEKESNKDPKESNICENDLNENERESNNDTKVFITDDKALNNDGKEDNMDSIQDENESNNYEINSIKHENELDNFENESNIDDNELDYENFESVDRELDSLLGEGEDSLSGRSDLTPESMEVDMPDCTPNMEHSDSMSIGSADIDDLLDSPGADDPVYSPDVDDPEDSDSYCSEESSCDTNSPPTMHNAITMHSAVSLTDGSSYMFSNNKSEGVPVDTNKTDNGITEDTNQLLSENVKHTSVSEKDSTIRSQKRNKRNADAVTSSKKKKVRLDEEAKTQQTKSLKKKLEEDPFESQASKKNKNDPELEFDNTEVNDNIVLDDSAKIESDLFINGQASVNEVMKMTKKLTWESKEIPPETMKEILEGRKRLFANYFEGKPDIAINRYVLEEMIMAQLIEFITYKCEIGQLRQKCRVLESEQIRMNQMVYGLKKQVEDAKYILKRLVDEKINNESWTQNTVPLKVTRSVGLQVCTCGPMTARSRYSNIDNRTPKIDRTVNKGSLAVNHSSIQTNECSKNMTGSSENKENISSNVESEAGNLDSNTDDVVIVSVTENKKSEIPSAQAVNKEKDTNVNIKKNVEIPESDIKKSIETPKNGIVTNEKNRKPFSFEQTKSPPVQKTETTIPKIKNTDLDIKSLQKEPTQTGKSGKNGGEIIDLTDKEDQPAIKSEILELSNAASSEQLTPGINSKTGATNSCSSAARPLVNGTKKSPPPSTSTAIKKLADISAGADLVSSYDHLPKYPASPKYPANVTKPPRPVLKIGKNTSGKKGILLSWSFEGGRNPPNIEEYQLYAFQESKTPEKVKTDTWKKIGDIKALPLPMACFLTQFLEGDKYHFIVRAVDSFKRLGDFSLPGSIILHAADQPPTAS